MLVHRRLGPSAGGVAGWGCEADRARHRVARGVSPIDYRDGLSPCLTNFQETDITTVIQRRRQHPRRTAGRDRSQQVVAIVGMPNERIMKI